MGKRRGGMNDWLSMQMDLAGGKKPKLRKVKMKESRELKHKKSVHPRHKNVRGPHQGER
jgi:hypothetical protein